MKFIRRTVSAKVDSALPQPQFGIRGPWFDSIGLGRFCHLRLVGFVSVRQYIAFTMRNKTDQPENKMLALKLMVSIQTKMTLLFYTMLSALT